MANLTIETKNHEGVRGQNYRALNAKLDGDYLHNTLAGESIADFTEQAIQRAIGQAIRNGFTAIDLNVTAAELSAGAKTQLADKYSGDPLVTTITFA